MRLTPSFTSAVRSSTSATARARRSAQVAALVHASHSAPATPLIVSRLTKKSTYQARYYAAKARAEHGKESSLSQKTLDLIYYASQGDLAKCKSLVEQDHVPAAAADYDRRSALHLAAAEGHLEVVQYLVANGANVHAIDRWGGSPLHDALRNGHKPVVQYLRAVGGAMKADPSVVADLIQAASDGNLAKLEEIISAGVSVDAADNNGRTALHMAAAKGHKDAVSFLLRHGANVNALDAFGNTPLQDAQRADSKAKREIAKLLQQAGAVSELDLTKRRDSKDVKASIVQSLPLLCQRGNWVYAEVWMPSEDGKELLPLQEWYAEKAHVNLFSKFIQRQEGSFTSGEGLPGRAYISHSPVLLQELPDKDLGFHADLKTTYGIKNGLAVPLQYNSQVMAILVFFSFEARFVPQEELHSFMAYANGLVASGIFRSESTEFADLPGISPEKMKLVFQSIVAEGVFNAKHIYQEVDWFYRMGIPPVYYEMFNGTQIANHLHSLIAAKKVAQAMGKPEEIFVHTENEDHQFWLVPATYNHSVKVETEIEDLLEKTPEGHSFSLAYLCSRGTFNPHGKNQLSMYVVDQSPYVDPKVSSEETNIWKVASGTFLRDKSFEIRARYQAILDEAVGKINPVVTIHEKSTDGSTPVTLALRHDQHSSFLLKFTEVLKYHKLRCNRKFVESFANGIVVYTFYLDSPSPSSVQEFIADTQLLTLVPGTAMRQLFLRGDLSVDEYCYAASIRKFVYYFLNQRNEEFDVLARALQGDPLNQGRLNLLATRLRREAVSATRITQAMFDDTPLIRKLYEDFVRCCQTKPSYNQDLHNEITKSAKSEINAQILQAFLVFNSKLLKTNFWKPSKAALAFSLDASFVEAASYPENPYIIFFVISQEFQGFHIRFRDISRGGIRVIKSANRNVFLRNLEGQFGENYDLALTQNKKNKDIPEFGAKGTILLHREAQANVHVAFQKYVSGLLDLLVIDPKDGIVDHYQKPELLFLGPDENTADVMEWAARYAQTRGYKYWKAFTTGKPPSLGGVPHDTYGMTTNSVHAYVVGTLAKLGLKEEEVTKFQTGGPDGDLGSNEILISKDKTIAIVDGSGVVYDPLGLNREELRRLALARKMISSFNPAVLSPGGFRVLISDTDIVLPHGEKVESGLNFRNEFHLHPLSKADLFVPCGGRPASVNLNNVKAVLKDGVPKWKVVIEGANLFLTQDARVVLEKAGVVLYKDASANKGGVTSSSLEVLAALAMTDSEHEQHMQVKDPNNVPAFYQEYVKQVQAIISSNAKLEFECIWREHQRTGEPRCVLTDKVSAKINQLNDVAASSTLYDDHTLRNAVLSLAIPKRLQALVPLDEIVRRIPDNYSRAIFSAYLSAHFVYKYGLQSNDFAFFEFISNLQDKAAGRREEL